MIQKERLVSECVKAVPGFAIDQVREMMDSPSFGWEFASYLAPLLEWSHFSHSASRRWRWIYAAMRFLWKKGDLRYQYIGHPTVGSVLEAFCLYRVVDWREIINAMLMMKHPDLKMIARKVGWSLKTIRVYQTLFFDIADHRDDEDYLSGLWREKGLRLADPARTDHPDEDERFLLEFGCHATVQDFCGEKGWTIPLSRKAMEGNMSCAEAREKRADEFRAKFLLRRMGEPSGFSGNLLITTP